MVLASATVPLIVPCQCLLSTKPRKTVIDAYTIATTVVLWWSHLLSRKVHDFEIRVLQGLQICYGVCLPLCYQLKVPVVLDDFQDLAHGYFIVDIKRTVLTLVAFATEFTGELGWGEYTDIQGKVVVNQELIESIIWPLFIFEIVCIVNF